MRPRNMHTPIAPRTLWSNAAALESKCRFVSARIAIHAEEQRHEKEQSEEAVPEPDDARCVGHLGFLHLTRD